MMEPTTIEKVISRDGTAIACYHSGSGSPLILVPGAGAANPSAWPVFPALAERFSVYAMDRRGHGESGDSPAYAIKREFEDIAALVDSLGETANVLGHSFGGLCALEAALLTPNMRKLVLYDPLSIPLPGKPVVPPGFVDRLQALLDAGDRAGVLSMLYQQMAGMSQAEIEQFRSSPAWPQRVATAHTLPRELRAIEQYWFDARRFKDLKTPTLLLGGGNSLDYERKGIELVAAALPDSQVVFMPGQQHIAMYTAPDLFLHEVLTFLLGES